MRTINKKLIESPIPPLNTKDVYWIDLSENEKGKIVSIKEFINGKWVSAMVENKREVLTDLGKYDNLVSENDVAFSIILYEEGEDIQVAHDKILKAVREGGVWFRINDEDVYLPIVPDEEAKETLDDNTIRMISFSNTVYNHTSEGTTEFYNWKAVYEPEQGSITFQWIPTINTI